MHAKKFSNFRSGLTLLETLISAVLMVIIFSAAAPAIVSSELLSSYTRHKLQAVSVAQQLLEQERRLTFSSISSVPAANITLDTKGTYNTTADDFFGSANITVTSIDSARKKVQVEISWPQRLLTGNYVTMKEYFATTIGDDPQIK